MLSSQKELAILGGPSVVGEGAVQPWPQVVAADKAAVMGVLERGVLWGCANCYRIDRAHDNDEYSAWSPTGEIQFHMPNRFGYVVFSQV